MSVLTPPHHLYVERALQLAKAWCQGHEIDDAPAIRHAVLVARTLGEHVPDVAPELVAAALLHDADLFAPTGIHLDVVLNNSIAPGVAEVICAVALGHAQMDHGELPDFTNRDVVLVAAADKIVAFQALQRRARRSGDETTFWLKRRKLTGLLDYFSDWLTSAAPSLPQAMAAALRVELCALSTSAREAEGYTKAMAGAAEHGR